MSIFSTRINEDKIKTQESVDGIYIIYDDNIGSTNSYDALEITTLMEAHMLRDVVNKAVDMFLEKNKKEC